MSPARALALVPMLVAAGCAEPPQALLDQAREVYEQAMEARAQVYAPDAIREAEAAIAAAEAEITAQREKRIPFTRNYGAAAAKLAEAMAAFERAQKATTEAKSTLKGPVRAALKDATIAVNLVEQELAKLRASRPNADLTFWRNEVAKLRGLLAAAGETVKSQDYVMGKAQLDSTLAAAGELQARLRQEGGAR